MKQTWRWFGPQDQVTVEDMLQAGVEQVVSALHHIPSGEVWLSDEIDNRKKSIATKQNGASSGLNWAVVESLPVSEDIKKQRGAWRTHILNYIASLKNLANAGINTVCYNFMPVLDWTRTDLTWQTSTGATCMRFEYIDFAAFDIHILRRTNAADDYNIPLVNEAAKRFESYNPFVKKQLAKNVVFGLPGAVERLGLEDVRQHLAEYDDISADQLRKHLFDFLEEVIPVAEKLGIRMCCHPDDPPFGLLGLPRIMSTEDDYKKMLRAVDLPANGITLCSGSLGARRDNDLPGMMDSLGDRVHFLHLRNVKRESTELRGSFYEAEHLEGDTDMVALIAAIFIHVGGLWLTSPPDVIDALTFTSPTPFSDWGVIAMWALFCAAALAMLRRRLPVRIWRLGHSALVALAVIGTVVHAMLIIGTMETVSKTVLSALALLATAKALYDLRAWARIRRKP